MEVGGRSIPGAVEPGGGGAASLKCETGWEKVKEERRGREE